MPTSFPSFVLQSGIILGIMLGGVNIMAQTTDDLQKEIDLLNKEKLKLIAEKEKLDAQKALDQAKDQTAQNLRDLQNQKAVMDAQKAAAEAQAQAALSKYIGEVKAGPYSGSVDVKEKTGTEEALLLGAKAVKEAAAMIAKTVRAKADKFYVFGAREFPSFQRLLTFRFRKELIKQAFSTAGIKKTVKAEEGRELPIPAMVSAGLDAFSKILGFFKTDYTVGGIEVKIDESLLLFSVAGKLSEKTEGVKEVEVHLPIAYEPNAQNNTVAALTSELMELVNLRTLAANKSKQTKDEIDRIEKDAADPANTATKDALLKTAGSLKPIVDQLNGVISLYDAFASSLTTPDSNGTLPLSALAQEFAIDTALKTGGGVLLLRLENSGGGYLVKKNLLTALGKMPLYHMGGATVTYLLLSGADGKVLAGDVIPVYGGFVKTSDLRKHLEE